MANTSRPMGFRPQRYLDDSPWNGQSQMYAFSASEANAAYKGDMVTLDSTNRSLALTNAFMPACPCVAPVVAAHTTNLFRGVIAGFVPQPEFTHSATASLGLAYRLASTERFAMIVQDTRVVFEVQESGNTYTTAADNATNKVIDIAYSAGNSAGISAVVALASTCVTNAVKPWRVLRYTQTVDNFNFTASDTNSYAHLDVYINSSDLVHGSTGA